MRFANDTHSRMLNRREMIGAGLALGLTGRAFAGRPGKRVDGPGHAGASGRSAGPASIQGPPALFERKLKDCGPFFVGKPSYIASGSWVSCVGSPFPLRWSRSDWRGCGFMRWLLALARLVFWVVLGV